ncbi:hypothetical protein MGE33_01605 [Wolbachia pipientis]|uniref:hypothetical protein n=1 Tax=Wolbachia TaxID=953 RepID=UPI00030D2306|nr:MULTISPECIES: hypothetical protein [Wolbachia]ERN55899.1 hypothetical protein WMELPOP_02228 [Wolbachia pipientis wMelPop]MCE4149738.1 hypothetical protein [Wolbachia endosymbiont of Drosophila melanogaster]MCE4151123.1 hypothetical protein [Wolbachia endosymbiont of Drosophila melanogaster]MDV6249121.1 hypothetical protein [Wolbachia endosymbiont of Zaprionus taronus]POG50269.1 hypothetical protein BK222_01280 [Wolbachia sp. wMel_AMD]
MARIIFMGVDVSKEALDISINGKHKRIANVSDAISKYYRNKYSRFTHQVMCKLVAMKSSL